MNSFFGRASSLFQWLLFLRFLNSREFSFFSAPFGFSVVRSLVLVFPVANFSQWLRVAVVSFGLSAFHIRVHSRSFAAKWFWFALQQLRVSVPPCLRGAILILIVALPRCLHAQQAPG